jgi:ribosomal protein L35
MRTKGGKTHFRRNRRKSAKRLYDNKLPVHPSDQRRLKELLPYS